MATLTLHAPPLNILTCEVLRQLRHGLEEAQQYRELRVLLIQAEGKHFSAGASVEEHLPAKYREMLADFTRTILALYEFPLPVIAAVQGRCLGGGFELVQAADLIVAADDAHFGQPEIQLGVIAPAACALLPNKLGPAKAAELLYTGAMVPASAAETAGMVLRVVPATELRAEALAVARQIARHSAAAVRMTKRALRAGAHSIEPALAATCNVYEELMATHDAVEGLNAFVQKRTPQWTHH
ncbi:MAG TPA: enoyl-CoA hydratase-related protein [Longimicrobiales bacterium]